MHYQEPSRQLPTREFDVVNHDAHMSTRNTVCCMGQGQAAGTAAALCAKVKRGTRELPYPELRNALERDGVYFER